MRTLGIFKCRVRRRGITLTEGNGIFKGKNLADDLGDTANVPAARDESADVNDGRAAILFEDGFVRIASLL